jgi:hypothetical protein
MLKRIGAIAMAGGATLALTMGLAPTSSFAATPKADTWTVTPGGPITGKNTTTLTLEDTTTKTVLTCTTSTAGGTAKKGSGLAGAKIAKITSSTFSNCTGPAGLSFTVMTSASAKTPWHLNATSYNASTGVTTGTITSISATLSGPDCSALVDGTSSTGNTGKVKGTYTNSSGDLKISKTGGNLHIYNVSGCLGLIKDGDASEFNGTYAITPKQTITEQT